MSVQRIVVSLEYEYRVFEPYTIGRIEKFLPQMSEMLLIFLACSPNKPCVEKNGEVCMCAGCICHCSMPMQNGECGDDAGSIGKMIF